MFHLGLFALLFFALSILATPLLDRSGALEQFAFALAEDAADQDAYLALPQIVQPSDNHGNGPLPQLAGNINRVEGPMASFPSTIITALPMRHWQSHAVPPAYSSAVSKAPSSKFGQAMVWCCPLDVGT